MSKSLTPGVPGPCTAPETPEIAPTLDDLLAALPARIEPVRRSRAFRLRLTLAALTLLLVPAVDVALIAVTSYGIWSHFASPGLVAAVQRSFGEPGPYGAFCVAGPILGLLQRSAREPKSPLLMRQAHQAADEVRPMIKAIRDALDGVTYPYRTASHGAAGGSVILTVGAYLGSAATLLDPAGLDTRGVEMLSQLGSLEVRIVSSLVTSAEHVESALGHSPLPEPLPGPDDGPTASTRQDRETGSVGHPVAIL